MIYKNHQIKEVIDLKRDLKKLMAEQRQAFIDYSRGVFDIPPPLQLRFPKHDGDCHIKVGFRENDDVFVIKIATGFYRNGDLGLIGLPPGDGVILVFSQKTGILQSILCDAGYLTTLRTALAAAVAAQLTPWEINHIGIIGTGQLAIQTMETMKQLYPVAQFRLWGRSFEKTKAIAGSYKDIKICDTIRDLAKNADLIITTTASTKPIIYAEDIRENSHIIALGADDIHKQECDPHLFELADTIIVDSQTQALRFGDTFHAIQDNRIVIDKVIELGNVLENGIPAKSKIMITDLTGIAAQDIAIAKYVMEFFKHNESEIQKM